MSVNREQVDSHVQVFFNVKLVDYSAYYCNY